MAQDKKNSPKRVPPPLKPKNRTTDPTTTKKHHRSPTSPWDDDSYAPLPYKDPLETAPRYENKFGKDNPTLEAKGEDYGVEFEDYAKMPAERRVRKQQKLHSSFRGKKGQVQGDLRKFILASFVDGYEYREIAVMANEHFQLAPPSELAQTTLQKTRRTKLLKAGTPQGVSPLTVQNTIEKNLELVKHTAESQIAVYLNKGLANKATRIAALIKHYNMLQEMIAAHRLGKRKGSTTFEWAVLPTLPSLLGEVRKTLKDIKDEVEPVKVNVHTETIHRIADTESAKAVEELRDHSKKLTPELRELFGTALAKHEASVQAQIRGDSQPDSLLVEPTDRPPDEG
jgi:hypothetical protein